MNEQVFRIVASVAAIGIFAYPFVSPAFAGLFARLTAPAATDAVKQKMKDVETVLLLSSRFSAAGSQEGVDLCQKLIDALIKPSK